MKKILTSPFFLLSVLALAVYGPFLFNHFVWDDYLVIVDNPFVKSWMNFPLIFSKEYLTSPSELPYLGKKLIGSGELTYRPVVTITYFLDYSIWKLNPFGYHLTNFFLHVVNSFLIFGVLKHLLRTQWLSFLGAALFLIHPVNTEAAMVISHREDLLCLTFLLLTFSFYLKSFEDKHKYALLTGSYISFFLALFSKEMAVVFPLILMCYDLLFIKGRLKEKVERFKIHAVYWLLVGVFLFVWFGPMARQVDGTIQYPTPDWITNVLLMVSIFVSYIGACFLPLDIHPMFSNSMLLVEGLSFGNMIISAGIIILIVVCALFFRKKNPVVTFGILWFFISLIPVSNILPMSQLFAYRYLYIPSLGFCLVIVIVIEQLFKHKRLSLEALLVIVSLYGLLYVSKTMERGYLWRNELIYRLDMLKHYPRWRSAHVGVGHAYERLGDHEKALHYFNQAKELNPRSMAAYLYSGEVYIKQGKNEEALLEFNRVVELAPNFVEGRNTRCMLLAGLSTDSDAIQCFSELIARDPNFVVGYYNLGVAYLSNNQPDKAKEIWEKGFAIDPKNQSLREKLESLKK